MYSTPTPTYIILYTYYNNDRPPKINIIMTIWWQMENFHKVYIFNSYMRYLYSIYFFMVILVKHDIKKVSSDHNLSLHFSDFWVFTYPIFLLFSFMYTDRFFYFDYLFGYNLLKSIKRLGCTLIVFQYHKNRKCFFHQ